MDVLPDGQQQVGLAQAGVAVDKEGIVVFPRLFRHGQGRGMGKLVGFSHDEAVKGIALHLRQLAVRVPGGDIVVDLVPRQHQQLKIRLGEEVGQGGADEGAVALGDDLALEVRGGVDHQAAVLNLHGLTVRKPGVDGRGRHVTGEDVYDCFPDIVYGIHGFHLCT